MTATTATVPGRHAGAPTRPEGHVSFAHVLRSEWIKFFSLRSTYWTLGVTVVVMVLFGLLMASNAVFLAENAEEVGGIAISGTDVATFGYAFGQVSVAVLGALIITGEYSTGMIRSTMTAVPKRVPALLAKGLVLTIVTFAVGVAGVLLSYLVTLPMLSGHDLQADLGSGETWRIFLGTGLYLAAIALLAMGIGGLVRNSAATIAAVLGIILLIPILVNIFAMNLEWVGNIAPYLPAAAGERIMATDDSIATSGAVAPPTGEPELTPWQGIGLLGLYVAAVLASASVLLRRRDV